MIFLLIIIVVYSLCYASTTIEPHFSYDCLLHVFWSVVHGNVVRVFLETQFDVILVLDVVVTI